MVTFDESLLLPGDCLVYRPSGWYGWIIAVKTWTRVSHVEVYFGRGWSMASRSKKGVDFYPLDLRHVAAVLRPKKPFDMPEAMRWFHLAARGQKYDWLGLLCFTLAVRQGADDRMFCSEFATRFYRQGGFAPFAPWEDADHIAPAQFTQSPEFDRVWWDDAPL